MLQHSSSPIDIHQQHTSLSTHTYILIINKHNTQYTLPHHPFTSSFIFINTYCCILFFVRSPSSTILHTHRLLHHLIASTAVSTSSFVPIHYSCTDSCYCSPFNRFLSSLGFLSLLPSSDFGNPAHVPMKLFSIFINFTNTPTTYTTFRQLFIIYRHFTFTSYTQYHAINPLMLHQLATLIYINKHTHIKHHLTCLFLSFSLLIHMLHTYTLKSLVLSMLHSLVGIDIGGG